MRIDFDQIPLQDLRYMREGEKKVMAAIYEDRQIRIMRVTLVPGASIGLHEHEESCEVIYVLSGIGTMLCDCAVEMLTPGTCSYCPQGHAHTFRNEGTEDVVFLAVIPELPLG